MEGIALSILILVTNFKEMIKRPPWMTSFDEGTLLLQSFQILHFLLYLTATCSIFRDNLWTERLPNKQKDIPTTKPGLNIIVPRRDFAPHTSIKDSLQPEQNSEGQVALSSNHDRNLPLEDQVALNSKSQSTVHGPTVCSSSTLGHHRSRVRKVFRSTGRRKMWLVTDLEPFPTTNH